jgi:branched-chain amino acid transport system permease protein
MLVALSWADLILIYLMFAASLNLLIGYTGVFAVAPAAFGAFGGYTAASASFYYGWNLPEATLLGMAVAALVAIVMGIPAFRLDLAWVIILTLGVQEVVTGVFASAPAFGGAYGVQVSSIRLFGHQISTPIDLFPVALVCGVIIFAVCWRFGESPYGRALRGIRDDETASRALGKNTFSYKLTVLVITGMMGAVAGTILTLLNGVAQPSLFGFSASIAIIAMIIIGGRGSLAGTALAAVVITLLTPALQYAVNIQPHEAALWQSTIYGGALVAMIYLRPQGIIPEGVFPRRLGLARRGVRRVPATVAGRGPGAAPAPPSAFGESSGAFPASMHTRQPVARTEAPVLRAEGLAKAFGGIQAVNGLSFELRRGAITALVGPNGAGKTTVFNLLTGFLRPDAGKVLLNGEDITNQPPNIVARKGMVRSFQDVKLFGDLSALENVLLGIQHHPGERAKGLFLQPRQAHQFEVEAQHRAYDWLQFVGMDDYAGVLARNLAFGQQKLVALARILAMDAEILLLDEPASGIDHAWVEVMLKLISSLRNAGRTICIVEHNLHVVGQLADHVYFMELGKVTAEGGFKELTANKRLAEAYFGEG